MVQGFSIGAEDHRLVGADLLNFIIDWLGQSVLVRYIIVFLVSSALTTACRYIAAGLYGANAFPSLCCL